MIPRYTPADVGAVWSDANRVRTWLRVELAACDAMADAGLVPPADVSFIRAAVERCDMEALARRALEIEETVHHDVIAFLTAFEELAGEPSRHVHFGLTSSDVLDTSFALQLVESMDIILSDAETLRAAVKDRALEHKRTPMIGRSHGIHAEPITFGFVLAGWVAELSRNLERLRAAREEIRVGKLSGAVGTSAHLAPSIERAALGRLGLRVETVATQVVPRDRHAHFFGTLATLASSLERFAVEVRHLQRTEVREIEEPFGKSQKGSSAMPHKKNPILAENVSGLARLMRGYALAAAENVALWHERDISHSSVERVIGPDATSAIVFMLRRMRRVVEGLVVHSERMRANLEQMKGLVFSQTVLLRLTEKGLKRQLAYGMVQRAALRVWDDGIPLQQALREDGELMGHLTSEELDLCFSLERHLRHIEEIIDRALDEAV